MYTIIVHNTQIAYIYHRCKIETKPNKKQYVSIRCERWICIKCHLEDCELLLYFRTFCSLLLFILNDNHVFGLIPAPLSLSQHPKIIALNSRISIARQCIFVFEMNRMNINNLSMLEKRVVRHRLIRSKGREENTKFTTSNKPKC